MTRKIKMAFYSDPGHGWLRVSRQKMLLLPPETAREISTCSYQTPSGQTFYLEEDCDAAVFIKWAMQNGFKIEFNEVSVNGYSSIRENPHFKFRELHPGFPEKEAP